MDSPRDTAEMASQLAQDRGHGKSGKAIASTAVEAIDRLEQAEARDLHEIVDGLAPIHVSTRKAPGERHEMLDQRLPGASVAVALPALEQRHEGAIRARTGRMAAN